MRMLYWNCHGAAGNHFHYNLRDMVWINGVDLIFISKTKISGDRATNSTTKLGFTQVHCVDAQGFYGELWVLAVNLVYKVAVLKWWDHFIHLRISGTGINTMLCTIACINPKVHRKKKNTVASLVFAV